MSVQIGIDGYSTTGVLTLAPPSVFSLESTLNAVTVLTNADDQSSSSGNAVALGVQSVINPSVNSSSYLAGATIYAIVPNSNNKELSAIEGTYTEARHNGSAAINGYLVAMDAEVFSFGIGGVSSQVTNGGGMIGVCGIAGNYGTGLVAGQSSGYFLCEMGSGALTADNRTVFIDRPTNLGTINHNYGLYIADQRGISTDTWSIYSVAGNNYFGGPILLGDYGSAPTSAGSAGIEGEIVCNSGSLYFCSVTGAAGSATWNQLSMTKV